MRSGNSWKREISSSHGGEYDVQNCLVECTAVYIRDDGGSTHLWNVGRQSFYTAVHPRRQFWTTMYLLCLFCWCCILLVYHLHMYGNWWYYDHILTFLKFLNVNKYVPNELYTIIRHVNCHTFYVITIRHDIEKTFLTMDPWIRNR
jgi:hypothetical protein